MRWTNGGMVVLLTVGACLAAPSWAYGDKNHGNGNGNGNHTAFSINSPTTNNGKQITSNNNSGGIGSTRNAVCKKARICKINQKQW